MEGYRDAGHLPARGGDGASARLPRQRRGVTPQMVGRYPDFDVLETADQWDAATRRVVLKRLDPPGRLRFFTAAEEAVLRALCDTLLDQESEPRVPVAEMLDAKLADGRLDGYQYEDMPDDRDTWRMVLAAIDATARRRFGASFADLDAGSRRGLCAGLATGVLDGDGWERLNVKRAYAVVMRGLVSEFYSHPWAWNEIGFSGPAYPRGYMRFGTLSTREPFETAEAVSVDAERDVESREP